MCVLVSCCGQPASCCTNPRGIFFLKLWMHLHDIAELLYGIHEHSFCIQHNSTNYLCECANRHLHPLLLQLSWTGLLQHSVFLQQNLLFFLPLLQFWKCSHCCCIDTPVEGPAEQSGEPASWPNCF